MGIIWYPPEGAHLYQQKFLRYEMGQLDNPREIDMGVRYPFFEVGPGGILMVGDGDMPGGDPVWPGARVLGPNGFRFATEDERLAFVESWRRLSRPAGPVAVTVQRRAREWWVYEGDSYWEIRLGGRLVRRMQFHEEPRWEAELSLYLWSEEEKQESFTFLADQTGRYRRWHSGLYVGAVPAIPPLE